MIPLPAKSRMSPLVGGALVIACLLAYAPALRGDFLWDDDVHISHNAMLRSATGLWWIWTRPGATPQYYPVTHTSFWVEYRLWGLNTLGYHLANVLLHAGSAILIWKLCDRLKLNCGILAGFLFALHPVHVESVAWMTERKNVLSCFLYLACALSFLRGLNPDSGSVDNRRLLGFSLLLFALALLAKSVTGTLPAALLLVIWWRYGRVRWSHVAWLAPMFAGAAVMSFVTAGMERDIVGAAGPEWELSLAQRAMIAGRAVWFYLGKLAAPINLTFIYPRWRVEDLSWLGVAAWVIAVFVLLVTSAVMSNKGTRQEARKPGKPGPELNSWRFGALAFDGVRSALVAVLIFTGTLFPALGFVNIYPMRYSFVADHFQYHASIAVIVLISALLVRVGLAGKIIGVIACVVLGALTYDQSRAYASSEALWTETINRNPSCWMAYVHLGRIRVGQNQLDDAAGCFAKSVELNPDQPEGYIELGNLLLGANQPVAALEQFRTAVRVRPDKPLTRYHLARGQSAGGDDAAAIETLRAILRDQPRFEPARLFLGSIYERQGRKMDAIELYQEGVQVFPESVRCPEALRRLQ